MATKPTTNYPAAQIVTKGGSAPLNSSTTTVVSIPITSSGLKPSYVRIALSAGAAYVRGGPTATSTTATTGDTIVTTNEALWLNCVGLAAIGGLQIGNTNAIMQISPLEEGALGAPTVASVV